MTTFTLTDEQDEKINKWVKKQKTKPQGTIGGTYTYSFTFTSLGTIIKVKNNVNGKEIDVTNYNEW